MADATAHTVESSVEHTYPQTCGATSRTWLAANKNVKIIAWVRDASQTELLLSEAGDTE